MIKFGVYSYTTLMLSRALPRLRFRYSIELLSKNTRDFLTTHERERVFEDFSTIDGVYKRTYQNRFANIEKAISTKIRMLFKNKTEIRVFDLAISDGVSSVEFFDQVSSELPNVPCFFDGSDKHISFFLQRSLFGTTIKDSYGQLTEFNFLGVSVNLAKPDHKIYIINRLLRISIPLLQRFTQKMTPSPEEVSTLHELCLNLLGNRKQFNVFEFDIFEPIPSKKYDMIRAMNILNHSYFSKSELRALFLNCLSGLKDEGILIFGSNTTAGSTLNGMILQKKNNSFVELSCFGKPKGMIEILQLNSKK